jgi:hypothetical protein
MTWPTVVACIILGVAAGRWWVRVQLSRPRRRTLNAELSRQLAERQIDDITRATVRLMEAQVSRQSFFAADQSVRASYPHRGAQHDS